MINLLCWITTALKSGFVSQCSSGKAANMGPSYAAKTSCSTSIILSDIFWRIGLVIVLRRKGSMLGTISRISDTFRLKEKALSKTNVGLWVTSLSPTRESWLATTKAGKDECKYTQIKHKIHRHVQARSKWMKSLWPAGWVKFKGAAWSNRALSSGRLDGNGEERLQWALSANEACWNSLRLDDKFLTISPDCELHF